jgi:hypothetical protein
MPSKKQFRHHGLNGYSLKQTLLSPFFFARMTLRGSTRSYYRVTQVAGVHK